LEAILPVTLANCKVSGEKKHFFNQLVNFSNAQAPKSSIDIWGETRRTQEKRSIFLVQKN